MATAGALAICSGGAGGPVATSHAAALVFYGLRLCLFLLRRETTTPVEIHQMTRRDASMGDRLKRAPVVVGCSVLYFLMAAPLRITARTSLSSSASLLASSPASLVSLAAAFSGFGLAAWGDGHKSAVKAVRGPDTLVTTGPFRVFRHPNYTGEIIGWTASLSVAMFEAVRHYRQLSGASAAVFVRFAAPWIVASVLGWAGMCGVLAGEATAGLEKKQKKKYGDTPEYKAWIGSSWSGPMITSSS